MPRGDVGGGVYYPDRYPNNRGRSIRLIIFVSWFVGRYGGYNDVAFQNGANDGYEKGLEDARKNRSFDPLPS
jgi:hypothetical protein